MRATDTLFSTTAQFQILRVPTSSNGTTFGPGSANNLLKSNGTSVYWTTLVASDIPTISITDKTSGTLPVTRGGTGVTAIANIQAGKDGDGNTISSTYLKLSGGKLSGSLELNAASGNSPALIFTRDGSLTDWKIYVTGGKLSFCSATDASTWTERASFADNSGNFTVTGSMTATSFSGSGASLTSLNASNISSGTVAFARLPTGTGATQVAIGNHTHSYLANTNTGAADRPIYITGNAPAQTTYRMSGTNTTATTAIAITTDLPTGNWYVNGTTDIYAQSDGVVYAEQYNSSWIHEIYGDYRTGQIAVRGKNNGTWQAWRKVLDSSNYTDYTVTKTGSGASGTWGISITGSSASCTGNAATATKATQDADGNTISSTYLKLSGGTLTGDLNIRKNSAWTLSLNNDINSGRHGLKSSGYGKYDGGLAWMEDEAWLVYRDASGSVILNGNCTGSAGSVAWGNVSGKPSEYTPASDSSYYVKSHGNLTSLGNGTPAAATKTYWTDNVGNGKIEAAYNTAGDEYSILFGRGSAKYGCILKFGYLDRYIWMLRMKNNSWQSDDWEKIYAGYADSAGSATTASSCTGNAATATKATQDGSGNTITSKYVTVDTDQLSITGQKRFTKAVQCYRYTTNNNLPAITMDKPGSNYIGIGADGTDNRIRFGPCTGLDGSAWVGTGTFNSNEWYFQGNITCTNNIKTASGCRIGESGGSLYLGNSGNQSWVYVQDMCSQDSSKWKIHTNGNAEFNGNVTAGQFNGYTLSLSTENTSDTWVPVMNSSTIQHRVLHAWLNNMTTVPVDHGGTGATNAADARANLQVPQTNTGSNDSQVAYFTFKGRNGHWYDLILYNGSSYKIGLHDQSSGMTWRI